MHRKTHLARSRKDRLKFRITLERIFFGVKKSIARKLLLAMLQHVIMNGTSDRQPAGLIGSGRK